MCAIYCKLKPQASRHWGREKTARVWKSGLLLFLFFSPPSLKQQSQFQMTCTYAYHQYTSQITSNACSRDVSQCHLQSHLPQRSIIGALSDTGYMHFIIENVTGEHLPRCHNLITVCKNDTAVGVILNTNSKEGFSRQICTLSDNVMPLGEIAVSTTMCFNIILSRNFTQVIWATADGDCMQKRDVQNYRLHEGGIIVIWRQNNWHLQQKALIVFVIKIELLFGWL